MWGLRIPVAAVVSMVADGMTVDAIADDLPDLSRDDVLEALRYEAESRWSPGRWGSGFTMG